MKQLSLLPVLITLLSTAVLAQSAEPSADELLRTGRAYFAQSLEDEDAVERANESFEALQRSFPAYTGRARVYLGALKLMQANHTFWPHEKLALANEGLELMDKGRSNNPNDIEALFIHGAICHELPFYFGRGDDAEKDFKRIARLLPRKHESCAPEIIEDIMTFISEEDVLSDEEKEALLKLNIQHLKRQNGSKR